MTLVAVAHGSRDPRAGASTTELVARIRSLRPDLPVRQAYLELADPLLEDVLAGLTGPAVVVPLLLSGGYHAYVDVPSTAAEHRPDALLGSALGPDPLLVEALADRLREAGWRPGDAVVLAAAGSRDTRAVSDSARVGELLSVALDTDVVTSFVSAASPTVEEAVRSLGRRRVVVSTYLLAPGFFADEVIAAARSAGASWTAPLGDHPAVARLVWQRYDEASRKAQPAS